MSLFIHGKMYYNYFGFGKTCWSLCRFLSILLYTSFRFSFSLFSVQLKKDNFLILMLLFISKFNDCMCQSEKPLNLQRFPTRFCYFTVVSFTSSRRLARTTFSQSSWLPSTHVYVLFYQYRKRRVLQKHKFQFVKSMNTNFACEIVIDIYTRSH